MRRQLVAVAAAATVTVTVGCTARSSPHPSPRAASRTSLETIETPSTATSPAVPRSATANAPTDESGEAATGRAELDHYRQQLAEPVNSDLPPDLFAELTDLGTRVELAYLTGVGREEWPGYFGPDNPPPLWQGVRVVAAGARAQNGAPDTVEVTVVWSGQPADGGPAVDGHISLVLLILRNGTWHPTAQFG